MNRDAKKVAHGSLRVFFAALVLLAFAGCMYKGAKVTEGTDLAVGVDIPVAEGALNFNALNYLSGFRLGVDRNAALRVKYTTNEDNSYFGVVATKVTKTIDAEVSPLKDEDPK